MMLVAAMVLSLEATPRALYPARGDAFHVEKYEQSNHWVERRTLEGRFTRSITLGPRNLFLTGANAAGNLAFEWYDPSKWVDGLFPPTETPHFVPARRRGDWAIRIDAKAIFLERRDEKFREYPGSIDLDPAAVDSEGTVAWLRTDSKTATIGSSRVEDGEPTTKRLSLPRFQGRIRDGFPWVPCEFLNGREVVTILRLEPRSGVSVSAPILSSEGEPTDLYVSVIDRLTGKVTPLIRLPYRRSELLASLSPPRSLTDVRDMLVCVEGRTLVLLWEHKIWLIDVKSRKVSPFEESESPRG